MRIKHVDLEIVAERESCKETAVYEKKKKLMYVLEGTVHYTEERVIKWQKEGLNEGGEFAKPLKCPYLALPASPSHSIYVRFSLFFRLERLLAK